MRIKYPRTPHLPWSPGVYSDDVIKVNVNNFIGKEVVVLEKMDGECTTMYKNYIHARSIDSKNHVSRDLVKSLHATIRYLIPEWWRFCGENMYAKHSIYYTNLASVFYLFGVYNELNECISWDDTLDISNKFGLTTPTEIYSGIWDEDIIRKINLDLTKQEGYVVRLKESFKYEDFNECVSKWVRKDHVSTDSHWMNKKVIKNIITKNLT